jgi:cytochrome c
VKSTALKCAIALAGLTLVGCSGEEPAGKVASAGATEAEAHPGEMIFMQCVACHSVVASEGHKIGPNLAGVVGRAAGGAEGFTYSEGMGKTDLVWTAETLDQFLKNPNEVIPGTSMIFAGVANDAQRADLIDYLAQQPD